MSQSVAPPPLVCPLPPQVEQSGDEEEKLIQVVDSHAKEGRLCGRSYSQIFQATAAFAIFCTAIGFLVPNTFARNHRVSRILLETLSGTSIGWLLPSILSERHGDLFKSLISDYATPSFLILSQVFLNMTKQQQNLTRPGIFGFFNMYGGMALACYVHSVISRRLGTGIDVAFDASSNGNTSLKVAVDSSKKRFAQSAVITAVGIVAIFTGVFVSEAKLFRDFGIILSGNGGARILSEIWFQYAKHLDSSSRASRVYVIANRMILTAFHSLPGAMIVAAAVAAQHKNIHLSMAIYAITGIVIGWNEHLRQARFCEVEKNNLYEVRDNREKRPFLPKSFFGGVKWFIGVPCILAFVGLTVLGYNPDENVFQKVDPFVTASITAFAATLYTSYFFSEIARMEFQKEPSQRVINTAYYYSHYSLGIALLFNYVMQKLLLNDEGIDLDGSYAGVWSVVAWMSLGWVLGAEASSRFSFRKPRVVSSLYMALFGRYLINHLLGYK